MAVKSAKITGIGHFVPEKILTNHDLEKMVQTSDEWITTRTGIKERRIASEDESTSDLAKKAAEKTLSDAGVDAKDIDLIIVATMTPDHLMPSTATIVQHAIGADNAAAFDLNAACSGFIYAITTAKQFISTGFYKNALVIGAETTTKFLDFTDRNTCVLFGDGAGAVLLEACDEGDGILGSYMRSDGENYITIPAGGSKHPPSRETLDKRQHYITMNGLEVYKFAATVVPEAVMEIVNKCSLKLEDVDNIIFHQANVRIIDTVCARLNFDREKSFVNLNKYGNTSAASIPLALSEALEEGAVKKGDTVVLVGFGAGMTWGATAVKL
jgi:3-oxoacyl-[acyl-carrier-protein] synthase-3